MEFQNKVAVVTGGASGIGKCIAGEFEKEGGVPMEDEEIIALYFARDEKAIAAVSKAFSGDTAILDAVVKRVEKGEQIRTEGKKLWESLR